VDECKSIIMPQGGICIDGRCLSVFTSVCLVPDPKSRTEGRRKLKIGKMEDHDAGDS